MAAALSAPSAPLRANLRTLARLTLAALIGLGAGACKSAAEWAQQADRDVYDLVQARRAELFDTAEPFSIEPPADSLRLRLTAAEQPQRVTLTLVDCLRVAAESNRPYQDRREALFRAALDLTLERYLVGWRPRVGGGAFVDGQGDTADGASGFLRPEVRRVLGTGAEIVTGVGLDLFRVLSTGDGWDLASSLSLAITQPLLRGAGSHIVYESLTQAERDLVYEVRAFERFRRTLAVDVSGRYYRLLQQIDVVANEEQNFRNLETLSERNRALAEAGRLTVIQADQASQNELRASNRLLVARSRLETDLDNFKLFLGLPIEFELELDPLEMARLAEALDDSADLEPEFVVAYARAERLDFRTSLERVEDAARRVRVAGDALRMGLDLQVAAGASSEPGKPLRYDFDDARWSAGLLIDLPVGRLPQRNAYRSALIFAQATQRSAEQFSDQIAADLREALRAARTTLESYHIQRSAEDLASRRVESTQLNLLAGRADTRDILEAQESLVEAQNASTRALIDYALARLALFRDMELIRVDETGLYIAAPQLAEPAPEVEA
jgi:outer membrane protein TolC